MNKQDQQAVEQLASSGALDEIFENINARYYQQWTDDSEHKAQWTLHAKANALKDLRQQFNRAANGQ